MGLAIDTIRRHHADLRTRLDQYVLELVAQHCRPEPFVELLVDRVVPYARAEEIFLYPIVEQLMGTGATATMRIDHEAIVGRIHRIRDAARRGLQIEGGWHAHEELRRLAIELGALLDVHFEKEERVYLPLLERKLDAPEQERLVEAMEMAA